MINANELRIGNIIRDEHGTVHIIDKYDFIEELTIYGFNFEKCNPIPLTEEWLLKFGFENKNEYFDIVTYSNEICISLKDEEFSLYIRIDEDSYYSFEWTKINFVHQLQNLYFALTGKELELK